MPKDLTEDKDNNGKSSIRSTKDIKAGLLRRAFDGTSNYTPTQIIALIQSATRRSRSLSEEHREALNAIDPNQPRSVLMLNALARHEGVPMHFTDETRKESAEKEKVFVMPDHLTMQ